MAFLHIVDLLVLLGGLLIWTLMLPQITLLLKEKQAKTNSLILTSGSFGLQLLLLIQAILYKNWPIAFVMSMSVIGNAIIATLIIYYRRFPGGR